MLTKVVPGHDAIALTLMESQDKQKKHARPYYMGTVILATARVRFDTKGGVYLVGEVIHEAAEQDQPTHKVRGRMEKYKKSMGEITAKGAYVVGASIWIAREVQ